jgi:hypothetical protein
MQAAFGHAAMACGTANARLFGKSGHQQDEYEDEGDQVFDDFDNGEAQVGEPDQEPDWESTAAVDDDSVVGPSEKIDTKIFEETNEATFGGNFSGGDSQEVTNSESQNEDKEECQEYHTPYATSNLKDESQADADETTTNRVGTGGETVTGENTTWYDSVDNADFNNPVPNPIQRPQEINNIESRNATEESNLNLGTDFEKSIMAPEEMVPFANYPTFEPAPSKIQESGNIEGEPEQGVRQQPKVALTNTSSETQEWSEIKDEIKDYVDRKIEQELEKQGNN